MDLNNNEIADIDDQIELAGTLVDAMGYNSMTIPKQMILTRKIINND